MRFRPVPIVVLTLALALVTSPAHAQEAGDEVAIRIGLEADESNFNPFIVPQAQPLTHDLTMLVYDSLFWSQSQLDPEPWLATGAEPSDDSRTWTVTLRDDVAWHDGEPFTADDVAFTFRYFSDDGGPGRYGPEVYQFPVFESATVIDDTTVELSFAQPAPAFKLLPGGDLPILPQHIWEGVEDPRADTTSLPVGTGPFKMVAYEPDTSYRLEANDDYFLGVPYVDALDMTVVPEDEAAYAALEAGDLDFVARNTPVELVEQIELNEELELIGGARNETVYLLFDTSRPSLDDQRVRKALSLALDVDVMLDTVEGGQGRLGLDTWTNPNSPWTRDQLGAHTWDLLAANQLLDSAGFPAAADGSRNGSDGQPLSFTLGVNTSKPKQIRTAELVAEQVGETGVVIDIELLDPSIMNAVQGDNTAQPPPVDMIIGEAESHAHDDPDHLFFLFHSSSGGIGDIFGRYANPDFDALVVDLLDEPVDRLVREPLLHEAQDILAEDVPVIALYFPTTQIAYRPAVYDGWFSDLGHGVFTKRSFLAPYAEPSEEFDPRTEPLGNTVDAVTATEGQNALDQDGGGGPGFLAIGLGAALVAAVGALGLGVFRLRSGAEVVEE